MEHSLSFQTWEDAKEITTECLFQCSCREWRIEVPLPHVMMDAFDERGFGVTLVRMGMDAGRQFEQHIVQVRSP